VALPLLTALVGCVVYAVWLPPTADLAAQRLRGWVFEAAPFSPWNNRWYGGHHTPGYSLTVPPLVALLGTTITGIAAVLAAAVLGTTLLQRLAERYRLAGSSRWASVLLVAGVLASLFGGRTAFLVGVAFGLAALLAALAERPWVTVVLALLSALSSPVAGVFVAIVGCALVLSRGVARPTAFALAATPLVSVLVLAVLFPEGGSFPYPLGGVVNTLLATAAVVVVGRHHVTVRWIGAGYAAFCLLAALAESPVGGNAARFAALAAPAGVVLLTRVPRGRNAAALALVVAVLVGVQWSPVSLAVTGERRPTEARFYQPLVDVIAARPGTLRVEVVPVASHDEADVVARHVSLARGWNRQLDRRYHAVFYGHRLDAAAYFDWLQENGVELVAIADVPLDEAGDLEADLLADPPDYLQPVLDAGDWRVFEVVPRPMLGDAGAVVTSIGVDTFTVDVAEPGAHLVKVRFSAWHSVIDGDACVREGRDGWTELDVAAPGTVTVETALSLRAFVDRDGDC
jgi:hypothetical protein